MDMGHHGPHFTWVNNQGGFRHIKERLDGAAINDSWKILFPWAILENYPIHGSDHSCLVLDIVPNSPFLPRPFKFEWAWTNHPNCIEHIESVWNSKTNPNSLIKMKDSLGVLPPSPRRWNKMVFGNIDKKISESKNLLERLSKTVLDEDTLKTIKVEESNLDVWLHKKRFYGPKI